MAGVTHNRNSPFSPFPVNSVTEILPSPYEGEEENGGRFSDKARLVQSALLKSDAGSAVTTCDGRIFRWHGVEPYTRKDGQRIMLLVWRGTCAACGKPFTVKTPQRLEGTKAFTRKHCDAHKQTGARNG